MWNTIWSYKAAAYISYLKGREDVPDCLCITKCGGVFFSPPPEVILSTLNNLKFSHQVIVTKPIMIQWGGQLYSSVY